MESDADRAMRLEHEVQRELLRKRVAMLAGVTVVLALATGALALWSEQGAKDAFGTYWDALFWTTTQLLTVSSSEPNPERALTKGLDVVLELWAVVIVTGLAATFTDHLRHMSRRRLHERRRHPA